MATSFGWRVDLAAGGEQALAMIAARIEAKPGNAGSAYDVVFIDWRMPELDGWETSCRIRQLGASGKLPLIVMVTAYDREMLAQRQQDLSPVLDGFVVKPVTASMLFDAVADARLEHRVHRPAVPMPAGARLEGLRLLLVDDNPANQQVASELLSNDGARVQVASSGLLALQALSGQAPLPDLILMDIQMPEMDGYQTTQAILRQLGPAAPPIVAMTANAMAADRTAALNAGMADHVGKPFDLAQLIEVILLHVGRAPVLPMAAAPALTSEIAAAPVVHDRSLPAPGINSEAALKRMGGLKSIYLMALRGFVEEAARLLAQIDSARLARDVQAAVLPLHTLKGLAGTIGAERLQALARTAESALKNAPHAWEELGPVMEETAGLGDEIATLVATLAAPRTV